ncbi:hypothetical protein ACFPJ1_31710 [Kribbella qitaiheensis]|uniref:hypothetical protein n=1 Tax=Kribbella qitaiheensis TaxID=1544730 RepID=UPI00361266D5
MELTETDLCYKYFAVAMEFDVDGVDVVRKGRFVTLVDMALGIQYAGRRISAGEDASIGFTEHEEVIHFRRGTGDEIVATSSVRSVVAVVDGAELVGAFGMFVRDAYLRLVAECPGLVANPTVRRLV